MNAAAVPASKQIDFQGGYERSIGALNLALFGANMILLHGGICAELTHHPIQAVLDDDLAGMIGRFTEGIDFNDETLAIDLIETFDPRS
jgi:trimethylamine--corrinoid protein Co-methyltransferase